MNVTEEIRHYLSGNPKPFSRKELIQYLRAKGHDNSIGSITQVLNRFFETGEVVRISRGCYAPADDRNHLRPFQCRPSDEVKGISDLLKERFPFTGFIVWDASAVTPFMQHVPNVRRIIVEIERIAVQAAFEDIRAHTQRVVFVDPTKDVLDNYSWGKDVVIVKPLVSQSPIEEVDGVPSPKLEKILVDILCDEDLSYARGIESFHVYESALATHPINARMLIRYAGRRNRADEVKKLLNDCNYDTSGM